MNYLALVSTLSTRLQAPLSLLEEPGFAHLEFESGAPFLLSSVRWLLSRLEPCRVARLRRHSDHL